MDQVELTHRAAPLVARYRSDKAKITDLQEQLDELKASIGGIVEADGKYKDELGYAEFREIGESITYPGREVDQLAQVWAESDDPVQATCGKLLLKKRKVNPSRTTLYVK